MIKKIRFFGWLALVALLGIQAVDYTNAPPVSHTGAPGENTCRACHGGFGLNPDTEASAQIVVRKNGEIVDAYVPGEVYEVEVSVSRTGTNKFGFQLTALGTANAMAGSWTAGAGSATGNGSGSLASRRYIYHTSSGTSGTGTRTWNFTWNAPATGLGNVVFYLAYNCSNANGSSSGDRIYTHSITLPEAVVIPQIVVNSPTTTQYCPGDNIGVSFTVTGGSFQSGNTFSLLLSNAVGGFGSPLTLATQSGTGSGAFVAQLPDFLEPGTGYKLKVAASGPATESAPSAADLTVGACVWPGDANDDGVVDVYDFFFVSGGYGLTGPARSQTSVLWQPAFPASDWTASANFQGQTLNAKYMDVNGDGIVNLLDVAGTIVNRGLSR
jgi:hypothetical protein